MAKQKTLTLKSLKEVYTRELKEKLIEEFFTDEDYSDTLDKVASYVPIIKDGENHIVVKCVKCGYLEVVQQPSAYMYSYECPKCKTAKEPLQHPVTNGRMSIRTNNSTVNSIFCKKITDEIFFLGMLTANAVLLAGEEKTWKYTEGDDNKWLIDGIDIEKEIYRPILFTKKFGFKEFKSFSNDSFEPMSYSHINSCRYSLPRRIERGKKEDIEEFFSILNEQEILQEYCEMTAYDADKTLGSIIYQYSQIFAEEAKRKTKEKQKTELVNNIDVFGPLPEEMLLERHKEKGKNSALIMVISKNGSQGKYLLACPKGHVFEKEMSVMERYGEERKAVCPDCGMEFSIYSSSSEACDDTICWWEKIEGGVGLRKMHYEYYLDLQEKRVIEKPLSEVLRIAFYPKNRIIFETERNGEWIKASTNDNDSETANPNGWRRVFDFANTEEEFQELVNDSFLKQTGIEQAWGLGDYKDFAIEGMGEYGNEGYLMKWYKKPYLELIVKSKLPLITKYAMRVSQSEDSFLREYKNGARNICELLKVSKHAFKVARERNINYHDLVSFNELCSMQQNFSYDTILSLNTWHIQPYTLVRVCQKTNTLPSKMLKYLESCYNNQCIERSVALGIFDDYYRMAKDIGFNIADNHIKFPNSLKKEHDKAVFAYKVVENEIKKKHFIKNAEKNKQYVFETDKFIVLIPQSPDEVVREGQLQHHCVASYVTRIENGETCICFIREKENIEKPYYTCEIRNDELYQVKGFSNKYPEANTDLMDFIDKWVKKKRLKKTFMYH